MDQMNRRQVLASGVGGAAIGAMSTWVGQLRGASEHQFKIGACDWSIGQRGSVGAMEVARAIGLDGVQVSFGEPGVDEDLRDAKVRRKYAAASNATGVSISSLAMGVLNKIPFSTEDRTEAWVGDCIDVMAKMGQKNVLMAFFGEGDILDKPELQAKVIERLKRLAPRAEAAGVTLGLETWLGVEDHERILDAVGSESVKVYYDVANMNKMGYDVYAEIRRLGADRICEIHCKENGFLLGQGRVDFEKVREAVSDIDYRGWLIIEGATIKGRSMADCYGDNNAYLRKVFNG